MQLAWGFSLRPLAKGSARSGRRYAGVSVAAHSPVLPAHGVQAIAGNDHDAVTPDQAAVLLLQIEQVLPDLGLSPPRPDPTG